MGMLMHLTASNGGARCLMSRDYPTRQTTLGGPVGKTVWIAAGIVVGTILSIVVNLVTNEGSWWLWPVLGLLVVTAIAITSIQQRRSTATLTISQQIEAHDGATVADSPQLAEGLR